MIAYHGNKKFSVNKICKSNNGRVLVIETETFLLLNLYNSRETFAGDFNFFFNQKLEAMGGNPVLEMKSISKVLQITENSDLIGI